MKHRLVGAGFGESSALAGASLRMRSFRGHSLKDPREQAVRLPYVNVITQPRQAALFNSVVQFLQLGLEVGWAILFLSFK